MKFGFIQGDFSGGELSPRAQGHVESDAYKAGLKLAANCAPTRAGSIASRAGLKFLLAGLDAHTLLASNMPVQHIPIHDGPYGDFVVEISPTGVRLLDKTGALPWNFPPSSELLQFTAQDGVFSYADADTRTVYLRSEVATGLRSYYLTKGSGAQNAIIAASVAPIAGQPGGTDESWTLSGKIAGDGVIARVMQTPSGNFQDRAVAPDANGSFSVTFTPNIVVGVPENFYIQLRTGVGTQTTVLWDFRLDKNAAITVTDTTTMTGLMPPTFGGIPVAPSQERIRHAAFWANGDFWVAFAGGRGNAYSGYALRWAPSVSGLGEPIWTFGTLPCTPNSLAKITGATTVVAYQNRVWYGVNLPSGKRAIRASKTGYGKLWNKPPQAGSTGTRSNSGGSWLFQFIVETETVAVVSVSGDRRVFYTFPVDAPKAQLIVHRTMASVVTLLFEVPDWTVPGVAQYGYEAAPDSHIVWGNPLTEQTLTPGGYITFDNTGIGPGIGELITVTRVALAEDPLDLDLASPTGKIAWINVLRGLMLGTTRQEKLFQGMTLALDPAVGELFDLKDESNHGADPALGALDVNDRVLFVQRGRKVLRLAGISITSDGGLVSEDIGVAGEHLTKARVRTMCFLKSPVQRVVFGFDDGTGAVMTLVGKSAAFSRFSIPTCFGGIYSVAGLDSDDDSELWVGTENGVTLWAKTFESDIVPKEVQLPNASPAAPTHLAYDRDNPLPPVMDGWLRVPLVNSGGVQYATGLPAVAVGQSAYALVNGQVSGPYVVAAGGKVTFPVALTLDKVWVDAAGARRAQEIYIGLLFKEHRWTSLSIEGGNPVGSSQNLTSRKPQLYLRLVDSYLPKVNGHRLAERGGSDPMDVLGARVTGDRRATEEGFQKASVVDVVMDLPLRMEVAAIFGGVIVNSV